MLTLRPPKSAELNVTLMKPVSEAFCFVTGWIIRLEEAARWYLVASRNAHDQQQSSLGMIDGING